MVDFASAFRRAGARPTQRAKPAKKKNYAEKLSRNLAQQLANALRADFTEVFPREDGRDQESPALGARGSKKLDVNYSTPLLGLGLGVSIKTINFYDARSKRFTKNYSRNDNELRAEAVDYHLRQPYSVLIAIVFLPIASAEDAKRAPSSFASCVEYFRFRSGRSRPSDPPELFEGFYVALYDRDRLLAGENSFDACCFFDVTNSPPRARRPKVSEAFDGSELLDRIRGAFLQRNNPPVRFVD